MELDELKKIWKQQKTDKEMGYSREQLLMLINNKMITFDKDIKTRDRIEWIACVIVIIVFGIFLFVTPSIWSKIGCVMIIFSALLVGYKLKVAKPQKMDPEISYDHSVVQHLEQELENVQTQKSLLKNIAWWYILPICLGLIVFTIGSPWYFTAKLIYMLIVVIMGIVIWFFNQKAVKERFEPLIQEIEKSLRFMETDK